MGLFLTRNARKRDLECFDCTKGGPNAVTSRHNEQFSDMRPQMKHKLPELQSVSRDGLGRGNVVRGVSRDCMAGGSPTSASNGRASGVLSLGAKRAFEPLMRPGLTNRAILFDSIA